MSKAGDKPGRGGRTVTDDEARLWQHATRSLEPVKAKPRIGAVSPAPAFPPPPRTNQQAPAALAIGKARVAPPKPAAIAKPKSHPPVPLADFDRRKARQIASGRIEVDARIDLHGLYQRDARGSLRAFLFAAHAKGHKTVLVITGKGGGAEEPADGLGALMGERQRGVIKRNVPHWLEEPDLRAMVLSYTQAGPRHGGSGALYVRLRKAAR